MTDDFEQMARDLRQGAGRELREEAAADEELSEIQRLRRRTLADAARSAMHRGDVVTVISSGLSVTHPVVAVGEDYLTMEGPDAWVDVRLESAVLSLERRAEGGHTGRPSAATLVARLRELEQESAPVEVTTRDGTRCTGTIEVVGTEHLVLADEDRRLLVPVAGVGLIFSRCPPRRR